MNADGSVDTNFVPGAVTSGSFAGGVFAIAIQTNGSIVIGGSFDQVAGIFRRGLARLLSNGTLDNGFVNTSFPFGTQVNVYSLLLEKAGTVLVGGASNAGFLIRCFTNGSTLFRSQLIPPLRVCVFGRMEKSSSHLA